MREEGGGRKRKKEGEGKREWGRRRKEGMGREDERGNGEGRREEERGNEEGKETAM